MDLYRKRLNKTTELPLRASELDLLNVFIGHWHAEGDLYGDKHSEHLPYAWVGRWESDETYHWMSGRYFVVHRWHARVGERSFKGLEIIGYDACLREYFSRLFDNDGHTIKYRISVEDGNWRFSEPCTRSNVAVNADGDTMTLQSEWRHEGGDWVPLCNRKAVKMVQP
jgi:hypothetical protein